MFHELERLELSPLNLFAVASRQTVFGVRNLVKLKSDAILLEFLRHEF